MPALSQNLTFTVNNTSSVAVNYPNTGTTALTYISDRVKGDGYFGSSDGLHSFQIQTSNFIGKIEIQASLALEPSTSDWVTVRLGSNTYSVDTTGLITTDSVTTITYTTSTSVVKTYNAVGNFVWLRGKISEFTQGSVNSIKYNY